MTDNISFFSGLNTENDLLPPDTAKDLYQIIISLGKKIDAYQEDTNSTLESIKDHINDRNNPHHLTSSIFSSVDLYRAIYKYYKNYYDTATDTLYYNQEDLISLFRISPLGMLECLRRISLDGLHVVEGLTEANSGNVFRLNYTNNFDIAQHGPKGFSNVPTYSFSRAVCPRELPYLAGLRHISRGDSAINPNIKMYFESNQGKEVTDTDPAYGVPFGNKLMNSSDSIFIRWDETKLTGNPDLDTTYVLAITPYHKAVLFNLSTRDGKYLITVTIADVDKESFNISLSSATTFEYYSDKAACIFTFDNVSTGYLSYLLDGYVHTDSTSDTFTFTNDYTCGKIYVGDVIDTDIVPTSAVDPNMNGIGVKDRITPVVDFPTVARLKTLEVTRYGSLRTGTGYVPRLSFIAERLSQL